MSRIMRPVIDCTESPDLLAGWPVEAQVKKSATAQAILADLDADWMIEEADLDGKPYEIDADNRLILLDTRGLTKAAIARSDYFRNMLAMQTFAGLRAAWQAERAFEARNMHRPDLWLFIGRLAEADIATLSARMAFEAKLEGDETIWRHAMGDENGDIALMYLHELERRPFIENDTAALALAFAEWFRKPNRVTATDSETLSMMDDMIDNLTMNGRGRMGEGAIRCLTIDPLTGSSYLGVSVAEFAGDPVWRGIADPVVEAHFLQVMDDIGTIRMGAIGIRDKKLAARLFPEALVKA
ncbi:MAG: hypothetical protein KGQ41_05780 [Alphaproteobacteria bacterium]|nr:hypothetical protein [Alphaproteobacteria bacterium]